jgi:RNA polymerase sigma-70 factor (ECF subfamily)
MSGDAALARVFLDHLVGASPNAPLDSLEADLASRVAAGRAAWPEIALAEQPFVAYLAARCPDAVLPPLERSADLYLACACARGDEAAIAAFVRTFRPHVLEMVARMKRTPAFGDDVFQTVSERLFLGGAQAKITEYSGRATLKVWLTTVAKRIALNLQRRKDDQREAGEDEQALAKAAALDVGVGGGDAIEVALLKARFKSEFEEAIRAALGRIPADERALLLMHLVDGVTLPTLAVMNGISRATVARRIASARDALCEETRKELRERAHLTSSEYESIAALIRSELEVSLVAAVGKER